MPESTSITSSRRQLAAQFARYATALLLLAMFVGTHVPSSFSPVVPYSDKVIHALAFLSLTLSLLISWELSAGVLRPQHYFIVWLSCTLYGAFDELTQIPVGRNGDGLDWLADIGGSLAGLVLYRLLRPLLSRMI